ncbi:hypothetical protein MHYP_G00219680 [Metynnis hypsauchen]
MLQKLNLSFCSISEEGHAALASALKSNPSSHLIELDLRVNDPGDTGVKKLTDLLEDPNCKLKTLRFLRSSAAEEACGSLTKALGINPLLLKELDLSGKIQGDSELKKISDLLEDSHCKTQKLKLTKCSITEEGCAALSSALCSNPSHLIELDLSENKLGNSGVKRICSLLNNQSCKLMKVGLGNCSITDEGCAALASAFRMNPSHLRELDLSGNNVGNSGVKHLSELLTDSKSTLEKLDLSFCSITEEGYANLASALISNPSSPLIELDLRGNNPGDTGVKKLTDIFVGTRKTLRLLKSDDAVEAWKSLKSNPSSHLIELDLRGNDPGETGVKKLTDLLENPNYKLKLKLLKSSAAQEFCDSLTKVLRKNPLLQEKLDLSGKIQGDSEMKKISDLLGDSHCRIKKLSLTKSSITEEGCAALSSALCSNPSHLIELDLSENKLENSGLKKICSLLKNQCCKLQKLNLSFCSITEEGYADLASALKSNPSSHLIELDLRGNDPGDTGVKKLTDIFVGTRKTLRLLKSDDAVEAWKCIQQILNKNPLLQRELDLSRTELKHIKVQQLCALLKDPHYRLEKLTLGSCSITDEGCAALASAFRTNPSNLRELNLSGNNVGNFGVKHLSELLSHSKNTLEKLHLSFCSIKEEDYVALASALKSNPSSHLIELDLRGNDPGDTGVKKLTDLLEDPNCKLKTVRLLKSSVAEKFCVSLGINPLLLTELDLSGKIQGDSELKKISDLLEDSHCRTQKLKLSKCSITEEGCANLSSALCSNPSHVIELDLSENKLGNSGVKKICSLLNKQHCKLQRLNLSFCMITEEGYAALASALKTKPSLHLMELDFRGNNPGDTGVKLLTSLFMDSGKTLRLLKSSDAEEACRCLKILGKNPLLQRELDLSKKEPKHIKVQQLCALLEDPHYRLEKLTLYKSGSVKGDDCADLVSALIVNPSHLRELDLNENKLEESGVQKLCSLLKNPLCKLEKLMLKKNSIMSKDCADLASALSSNVSHLRELDLSENEIQDSGTKDFCAVLKTQECKLKKLLLKNCGIKEEGCAALTAALKTNSSHLKELDLCGNKLGKSFNELAEVLKDSGCKIQLDSSQMRSLSLIKLLSWFGGPAENTASEAMTADSEEETGEEGKDGKQMMMNEVDEHGGERVRQDSHQRGGEREPQ